MTLKVLDYQNKVVDKTMRFRENILKVEEMIKNIPGSEIGHEADKSTCPLKHSFVDGAYVREIFMPKGLLLTSKIHKVTHPYFIMKGKVTVSTEDGCVEIEAPYSGITVAGTKRLLYIHEDTVWITVHVTKEKDLDTIEEEIIATSFEEIDNKLEHKDVDNKLEHEDIDNEIEHKEELICHG